MLVLEISVVTLESMVYFLSTTLWLLVVSGNVQMKGVIVAELSGGSFYAFALPLLCVSWAMVRQTQLHKRSHITASVLI